MKIFLSTLILLIWGFSLTGSAKNKLISIDIYINGVLHTFSEGDLITVFRGDLLKITDATLAGNEKPMLVNLIGFRRSEVGNPFDDRNKKIIMDKDLNPKWSRERLGTHYDIVVSSQNEIHGTLYLEVKTPTLEEVEISLNGKTQKVRPGDVINMSLSDQFQLKHVSANFDINDAQFRYEIVTLPEKPKLVFQRHGREVASFPIHLR